MTKRYPTMFGREANGGWCDWIAPKKGYRMACCDCGLIHELEVKAFKKSRAKAKPGYLRVGEEIKGTTIMFRVRRNKRATAQFRRKRGDDIAEALGIQPVMEAAE